MRNKKKKKENIVKVTITRAVLANQRRNIPLKNVTKLFLCEENKKKEECQEKQNIKVLIYLQQQ